MTKPNPADLAPFLEALVASGVTPDDLLALASAVRAGVTPDDILALTQARHIPTVAEYVDTVIAALTPGSKATYRPHLHKFAEVFGERRLDDFTPSELTNYRNTVLEEAAETSRIGDGAHSAGQAVNAIRALFRMAEGDGHLETDPSIRLTRPRRPEPRRRSLTDAEMAQLINAVQMTSTDPDLDLLLLDFHLETGARRGGAINARLGDIGADHLGAIIMLREKNKSQRAQPISSELRDALVAFAAARGSTKPSDPLFRYTNGNPLTRRRYNTLFDKVDTMLPWAKELDLGIHAVRHFVGTRVERVFGTAVAAAYLRHSPKAAGGVTGVYTQATIAEVRAAHRHFHGE
jgi:integrase